MQDLAVNTIKIDQAFVENISTSGLAIIEAILKIADTLDYKVVAKGVETKKQAILLKEMGVHFLQGFYIERPLEYENIAAYLANADASYDNVDDFKLIASDANTNGI